MPEELTSLAVLSVAPYDTLLLLTVATPSGVTEHGTARDDDATTALRRATRRRGLARAMRRAAIIPVDGGELKRVVEKARGREDGDELPVPQAKAKAKAKGRNPKGNPSP